MEVLFTVAQRRRPPKSPLAGGWINKGILLCLLREGSQKGMKGLVTVGEASLGK